jgi:hypothetical protein
LGQRRSLESPRLGVNAHHPIRERLVDLVREPGELSRGKAAHRVIRHAPFDSLARRSIQVPQCPVNSIDATLVGVN